MKKQYLVAVVLLLGGLLAGAYFFFKPASDTLEPKRGTVIQAVYATGEVEPVAWSKMATQIPGKVDMVFVKEGDKLTKGQILLKLDDGVERTKLNEYQARLTYLEKEKARYTQLQSRDYTSRSKYERILSDYKTAKAQLDTQKEIIERMTIKSPLAGVVLKRDVEPGETITMSNIIFWVGKLSPLRISAEVDEEDIALVKVGQKALIKADAFPDTPIKGTISEITPKGDPIDKNFRVRIALPKDTQLLIGMTVEINIIAKTIENALIVPISSVVDGKVWVQEGRKFKERSVKLGARSEKEVQVLGGLKEGEVILRDPETALKKKR